MIKKIALVIFFLFIIFLARPVFASSEEAVLVKFNSYTDKQQISRDYNIDPNSIKEISRLNTFRIKNLTAWQKSKLFWNKFFGLQIKYIEPDYQYSAKIVPNDPYYSNQWALPDISAPTAWNLSTGSVSTKIAIVDTGVNGTHTDLSGKVIAGYDFVNGEAIDADSDSDDYGHGTLVAGVAAGIGNNGIGIAGLDWQAQIMPVKVLDYTGSGYSSDIASGIIYAADNGAKIINMSLGGQFPSTAIEDAVNYAHDTKGVLVLAASGNENSSISYPARYSNVMAIGATNSSDSRWSYSNYGPELAVVAPGVSIYSTSDSGGYSYATGTSLATPYVSGLAGLAWSVNPSDSNDQIESLIENTADKVAGMGSDNFNNYYGYGRINAFKALNSYSENPSDYHYQWISQNAYPTLGVGGEYEFTVSLKNVGSTPWQKGIVNLGTANPLDRTPVFTRGSGWTSNNRVEIVESSVAPGETATFTFQMTVPDGLSLGTYREYFRLVADGIVWMEDYGIYWDVAVKSSYSANWISQNSYPTLGHLGSYQFEVVLRNNGYSTWTQDIVRLGTSKPQDRIPSFTEGFGWLSTNRVQLVESSVAPGANGTFRFTYTIPDGTSPGTYREYFRPVADGIAWMEDYGIYWDVTVLPDSQAYHTSWVSQNAYPTLNIGDSYQFEVILRNEGGAIWNQNIVNLGTSHLQDRIPSFTEGSGWLSTNRVQLVESSVAPGANGTFRFTYTVPIEITPGTYREYFRPVADGITWMEDWGIYWDVTVN